ncbi:MAG: DUF4835 family protein [Bacteroidales bacterium]
MRKLFLIIFILLAAIRLNAQEFICSISVSSPQVQGTDRTVYSEMQKALYEFVNQRKWSGYNLRQEEKIECTLMITISDRISTDEFKGTMNIQLRRPIFRTSYNSPVINYVDKNIQFRYLEGQNLEFSDNTFTSNLTSLIAFYVNIFLGFDFDTYSLYGGTQFFQKAQSIVNSAQSTPEYGWKAFESLKNRYWLAENLLNSTYSPLREALYKYHRLGLDGMNENMDIGRASIMEAIELIKKVNREKPNLFLVQLILEAKVDELVNIFSQASPMDKTKVVNTLKEIDPANASKYQKILTTN